MKNKIILLTVNAYNTEYLLSVPDEKYKQFVEVLCKAERDWLGDYENLECDYADFTDYLDCLVQEAEIEIEWIESEFKLEVL